MRRIGLGFFFLSLFAAFVSAGAARAATFVVTKTADTADGACDADCSLREAVIAANAAPGIDTIRFAQPGLTYNLQRGFATSCAVCPDGPTCAFDVSDPTAGDLEFTEGAVVEGVGVGSTWIVQEAQDRVIEVFAPNVTLRDVRIAGGRHGGYVKTVCGADQIVPGAGGGILVHETGSLYLDRVEVSQNDAAEGESCLPDCELVGGEGGGILARGPAVVNESLIYGNSVGAGGGDLDGKFGRGAGASLRADSQFVNSTISSNFFSSGSQKQHQVHVFGATAFFDSSVIHMPDGVFALRTADHGGVVDPQTLIVLRNSIISAGPPLTCSDEVPAQLLSLGYNIDGVSVRGGGPGTCALSHPTDLSLDPRLLVLADNGGPTRTHKPEAGSYTYDSGDPANCPPTDQRGVARPQGAGCDRGAFEADPGPPPCVDADGDGYNNTGGTCGPRDCDDGLASVNPGATEVRDNGLDDDCDRTTPDCRDRDGDGYAPFDDCGGNGCQYSCGPADCNDADPSVHPGAAEIPGNAVDENCNGNLLCGAIPGGGAGGALGAYGLVALGFALVLIRRRAR